MAKLLLKFNTAVIKEIPINKDVLTVGRKPGNDIIIDSAAISGKHCKIFRQAGKYFVEDLKSTNGTFVNDKKVLSSGLQNNDVIGLVKHSLVFIDDTPVAPAGPPPDNDATMVISAAKIPEVAAAIPAKAAEDVKVGVVSITKGMVAEPAEIELTTMSTYIGKSDRMTVRIKGLFAPDVAAMITRRGDQYVLVAVKAGYPVVNGEAVNGQRPLQDGDEITVGSTSMIFSLRKK
ncbi:MAG: hypothetical protein A3G41_03130 [Elusimicrobia bacterium RIFCSPLOWO2_12_FULL_59_9]|nr:MAG: hypothetical protein A3G41_03130 [Elusimicrobia bacterium RIFCSPLOWO2_12_FULL_59_9]